MKSFSTSKTDLKEMAEITTMEQILACFLYFSNLWNKLVFCILFNYLEFIVMCTKTAVDF